MREEKNKHKHEFLHHAMSSHQATSTKRPTASRPAAIAGVDGGGDGGGIRDGVGVRGVAAVGVGGAGGAGGAVGEDDGVDDGNMGRGACDYACIIGLIMAVTFGGLSRCENGSVLPDLMWLVGCAVM